MCGEGRAAGSGPWWGSARTMLKMSWSDDVRGPLPARVCRPIWEGQRVQQRGFLGVWSCVHSFIPSFASTPIHSFIHSSFSC